MRQASDRASVACARFRQSLRAGWRPVLSLDGGCSKVARGAPADEAALLADRTARSSQLSLYATSRIQPNYITPQSLAACILGASSRAASISPRSIATVDSALKEWTSGGDAESIARRPLSQFRAAVLAAIRWRHADAALLLLDWRHNRFGRPFEQADLALLSDALGVKHSNSQVDVVVDTAHRVIDMSRDAGMQIDSRLAASIVRLLAGAPPTRAVASQVGVWTGSPAKELIYVANLRSVATGKGGEMPVMPVPASRPSQAHGVEEDIEPASSGGHFGTTKIAASSRMTMRVRQSLRASAAVDFLRAWAAEAAVNGSSDAGSAAAASGPADVQDGRDGEGPEVSANYSSKVSAASRVVGQLAGPLLSGQECESMVRSLAAARHGANLASELVRALYINGELGTAHRVLESVCRYHTSDTSGSPFGSSEGSLSETWFVGLLQSWCARGDVDGACSTLRLMRSYSVKPGTRSLHALNDLYLRVSEGHRAQGSAAMLAELAAAIGVKPAPKTVGAAAFYAGKHRNWREVQRLERLDRAVKAVQDGRSILANKKVVGAVDDGAVDQDNEIVSVELPDAGAVGTSSWFHRLAQYYQASVSDDSLKPRRRAGARQ